MTQAVSVRRVIEEECEKDVIPLSLVAGRMSEGKGSSFAVDPYRLRRRKYADRWETTQRAKGGKRVAWC